MFKKISKRSQLELKNIFVSYQEKDDSIHLISKDKKLAQNGFRISLRNGTSAEAALRSLLVESNIIRDESREQLPTMLRYEVVERAYGSELLLGKSYDGNVFWHSLSSPLLIMNGSGKATILRSLFFHAVSHGDKWVSYGIDYSRIALNSYVPYKETFRGLATSPVETNSLLMFIQSMMKKRYDEMVELGVSNFLDLSWAANDGLPPKSVMLVIDELSTFAQLHNADDPDLDEEDSFTRKNIAILDDILAHGAAAGIHVVAGTQRNTSDFLKERLNFFGTKIAIGRLDLRTSQFLFGGETAARIPSRIQGRGLIEMNGEQKEFQSSYLGFSEIDEHILQAGGTIEKERYLHLTKTIGRVAIL